MGEFNQGHIDRLMDRRVGRMRIATEDGFDVGWAAGSSVLDVNFTLENIINDSLHFDIRITRDVLPADLMKAYYEREIKAMQDVGVQVGQARRRQCKTLAREQLEEEARDGRFQKHRLISVMWDRPSGKVYFGNASLANADRFCSLFEQTFQIELELESAGARMDLACGEVSPSAFVPGVSPADYSWIRDSSSRDWIGNEFLLWLWYYSDVESDTIKVADDTELTFMIARFLTIECPRGQTGYDAITHEGPTRLPEARRAIQSGKMPRKIGLTVVRQDTQYEFALNAEIFGIGSAKFTVEEDVKGDRPRVERRVELWRELNMTIDLLYDAFLRRRCSSLWQVELECMQKWLKREDRR